MNEHKVHIGETSRETKKANKLDAVIVIPSLKEDVRILDTIWSAVMQVKKRPQSFRHGIVVVVNNRPDVSEEIKISNMRTYTLLQMLEHKVKASIKGDKRATEKIADIQAQNIPIHVLKVDSPRSTVGLARKLGTEHAISLAKEDGFIVSTDADTHLGKNLLQGTQEFYEDNSDFAGISYYMNYHDDHLTPQELKSDDNLSLYFDIINLVTTGSSKIESTLNWMAGGGSSHRILDYLQTSGYDAEKTGEEDTSLGIKIVDAGGKIETAPNIGDHRLVVETSRRTSDRASMGMGHSIGKWDESKMPFQEMPMDNFYAIIGKTTFYRELEERIMGSFSGWCSANEIEDKEEYQARRKMFNIEGRGNKVLEAFWASDVTQEILQEELEESINTFDFLEEDRAKLREALSRFKPFHTNNKDHHSFYWTVKKAFENRYPNQKVKEVVAMIISRIEIASKNYERQGLEELRKRFPGIPVTYELFEANIIKLLAKNRIYLTEPQVVKTMILTLKNYKRFSAHIDDYLFHRNGKKRLEELAKSETAGTKEKDAANTVLEAVMPRDLNERVAYSNSIVCIGETIHQILQTLRSELSADDIEKMEAMVKTFDVLVERRVNAVKTEYTSFYEKTANQFLAASTAWAEKYGEKLPEKK
jgi:hypothetical protein